MAGQNQSPATKEDIKGIMEYLTRNEEEIHNLKQQIRNDKEEIKHHFDVVAENIHHDLLRGALNDKVEQYEDRIIRIEHHVGIAA